MLGNHYFLFYLVNYSIVFIHKSVVIKKIVHCGRNLNTEYIPFTNNHNSEREQRGQPSTNSFKNAQGERYSIGNMSNGMITVLFFLVTVLYGVTWYLCLE